MTIAPSATDRTLPHDLDAEKAVLGAILIDESRFAAAAGIITADDFFRDAHRRLFDAMAALHRDGTPIDLLTLKDKLASTDELDDETRPAYISSLTDGVPRATNVRHYANIVRDTARRRTTLAVLVRAIDLTYDTNLDDVRTLMRDWTEETAGHDDDLLIDPIKLVATRLTKTPAAMLIDGLMPAQGNTLIFGLERVYKSLLTRAITVAVAGGSGSHALGLPRLRIIAPSPVVYITEEDSESAVYEHLDAFADGCAAALPIFVSACKGLNLDDPSTQAKLIQQTAISGAKLVVLEPLRSLTACVDRTPGDLQPFTRFLRRWARETGVAFLLGHHAVKPAAGYDSRKGAQRVSGGGLLSISESPIENTRFDDEHVLITPMSWKHTAAPPPLVLRLDTEHGRVRRLVAEEYAPNAMPTDPTDVDTAARLIKAATLHPGKSGTALVKAAGVQKATGLAVLAQLAARGRLRYSERHGKGGGEAWYAP